MKTVVLNLHGGPGTGKSTTAAGLFYHLKQRGVSAELVREYVKDWAWDNRSIRDWDQLYFLGKQIRRESMLYGKVPVIVTDAPVLMNAFYASKFSPLALREGVMFAVERFYQQCKDSGILHRHVFLRRSKAYDPNGRYQTEEQVREMDKELLSFLINNGVIPLGSGTGEEAVRALAGDIADELGSP